MFACFFSLRNKNVLRCLGVTRWFCINLQNTCNKIKSPCFHYNSYGDIIVALTDSKEKRGLLHILHFSWLLSPADSHMKNIVKREKSAQEAKEYISEQYTHGRICSILLYFSWSVMFFQYKKKQAQNKLKNLFQHDWLIFSKCREQIYICNTRCNTRCNTAHVLIILM